MSKVNLNVKMERAEANYEILQSKRILDLREKRQNQYSKKSVRAMKRKDCYEEGEIRKLE